MVECVCFFLARFEVPGNVCSGKSIRSSYFSHQLLYKQWRESVGIWDKMRKHGCLDLFTISTNILSDVLQVNKKLREERKKSQIQEPSGGSCFYFLITEFCYINVFFNLVSTIILKWNERKYKRSTVKI